MSSVNGIQFINVSTLGVLWGNGSKFSKPYWSIPILSGYSDGSYTKVHLHSVDVASDQSEGLGQSCAGNTSKIHLAVHAYGLPIAFEISGGKVNDCIAVPELIA